MSANFYDLLKYAQTGQASPEMTHYDKMRALAMAGGGKVETLTGIPPLSFKSNGKPLILWSVKGNGQQTGTPTPDAPIQPTFCGVRTGNLAKYWKAAYVTASGTVNANRVNGVSFPVKIEAGQTVCFTNQKTNFGRGIAVFSGFDGNTLTDMVYRSTNNTVTYTADSDCYVIIWCNYDNTTSMDESVFALCGQMLNLGSTALPYEPYGWKIPLTCAGQTVPIYLGELPTVRRIGKVDLATLRWTLLAGSLWRSTGIENIKYVGSNTELGNGIAERYAMHTGAGMTIAAGNIAIDVSQISVNTGNANTLPSGLFWYALAEPETTIVNEPLCKIGDYADELHSEDAGVTIPTVKGQNTLTVDTELPPSEMTITYKDRKERST